MAIDKITTASITDGTIATADIADGAVTSVKTTGVGGDNTPAFGATASTDQNNLNSGTFTLQAFDTEVWDTDGAYNNTSSGNGYAFTVPSGEAGKYFITAHIMIRADATYEAKVLRLNKNGNFLVESEDHYDNNYLRHNYSNTVSITTVQNLAVGDYIQVYGGYWENNDLGHTDYFIQRLKRV